MSTVVDIMTRFGDATGLCMNMAKSAVLPIRCGQIDIKEVLQCFNGERTTFPMSYLGLLITLGRLRMVHLQPCLDRAAGKLTGWQGHLLNYGRRRELIRTVLSALPTYLLTVLKHWILSLNLLLLLYPESYSITTTTTSLTVTTSLIG
jgi:hypothetical protein